MIRNMKKIIAFLRELETNNNRDWFESRKPDFQDAKKTFEQFIGQVILKLGQIDPRIKGIDPRQSIFRIYRDTRFSSDKTPYKNNFGAHISRGGKNSGYPGYYFHMQPGEGFLSGGIYMPDPARLKAVRKEIYLFPEDYKELVEHPDFRKHFTLFEDDKLKKPPAGFPADFELIEVLKHKNFCPWMPYQDDWLDESDLVDQVVEKYALMMPFNEFLYRAIDS